MSLKKTPFPLVVIALSTLAAIPLDAQTASFTIEAESMALSGYVVENANRIRLTATTGTATKPCACPAGNYDIQVFVQPETDGQPTLAVYKGTQSTPLQTFTYPLSNSATSFTIRNVALGANEPIRLLGTWKGGAVARVDKVVLTQVAGSTPAPTPPSTSTPPAGSSYAGTPFSGTPIALPKAFFAKDFDRGGEGVAYHDLTAANTGGQYRTSEGVDIIASTDAQGGGHAINNGQAGEWIANTVNVAAEKNYDLAVYASNNQATPASFHIEVDGVNVSQSVSVPKTGSWSTFQWVGKQGVKLTAGKHVIKVVSDLQFFNMSAVSVLESAAQPSQPAGSSNAGTPFSGTPIALPGSFFAKDFDRGGEGVAYHDLTPANTGGQYRTSEGVDIIASTDTQGGGHAINSFQTGEWLAYTVNVSTSATYDLAIYASNNQTTPAAYHIEIDGVNVTGSVSVPRTGSWTTFQWVGKQGVQIAAGKHVLKVVSDQQFFNLSSVSVLPTGTAPGQTPAGTGGPSVSLTSPTSGQQVSGMLNYAANVGTTVTKVHFTVSSATPMALGARTAAPFGGTLDTTRLENGSHTLTAVASDAQGRTTSSQVAFTVQNGTTTTPPAAGGTKPASMIFWSGFENGVSVSAPRNCYSAGCWQDVLGKDAQSGFTWPPKVGGGAGQFQVRSGVTSTASTIGSYITNTIDTVTGHTGAQTRVLHSRMYKTGCTGTASQSSTNCSAQDPYLLQPTSDPKDLYISFWRKIDPALAQKLVNGWHVVFEWKTTGDYRIIAQIVNYGGVTPYFEARADNVANGGLAHQEFWRVNATAIKAPIGQWFKFEVFWHRSKGTDGRVWMAVNCQKIVDKFGPNIGVNNNPIDRIFLMQLYTAASYPLSQWTDDIQIWSTFPTAKPGDPWYDGVYGPH